MENEHSENNLSDEELAELYHKVDATTRKDMADTLRKALEIGYPDEEPQDDDLLPADTALMEKCICEARWLITETREVPVRVDKFQATVVYQTAHFLFIGALADRLVGAVGDLQNTIDVGLYELDKKFERRGNE